MNIFQLIFPDTLYYNEEIEKPLEAIWLLGINNNNRSDIESIINKKKEKESPETIIKNKKELV